MTRTERIWARRWLIVLAGGIIMGSSLGVRHVQGLFLPPITLDQGWSRESFAFALAMQNLIWGLAQPFTGMIADRFGSLKVLIPGMLLYALGLVIMAIAGTTGTFLMGNGILIGIALSGTAFGAVYGTLSRIFPPEHRSWALGVAGALGGLGQFLMVPVTQGLLDGVGWISALIVLAVLMVVLTPVAAWLRDDPEGERQEGVQHQSMTHALREAGGHRGFLLLNLGFVACGFQLAFIASHMPAYLMDGGLGPREASIALALITLSNIVGTYLGGYLGGFLRRKYVLAAIYAARAAAMALFIALPLTPLSTYVFALVIGLLWLGVVPLTTGLISQIFGVRYITTLFGVVFFGHQVGSFFGVWLGGYVFDMTQSYDLVWYIAIGLGVFAAIMHMPINDADVSRTRTLAQPA
jgi:MFS family permease